MRAGSTGAPLWKKSKKSGVRCPEKKIRRHDPASNSELYFQASDGIRFSAGGVWFHDRSSRSRRETPGAPPGDRRNWSVALVWRGLPQHEQLRLRWLQRWRPFLPTVSDKARGYQTPCADMCRMDPRGGRDRTRSEVQARFSRSRG